MYYFYLRDSEETFADHSLKRLYKLAVQTGIDRVREYGHFSRYDIIRIYDENDEEVVTMHFGQVGVLRGQAFSTVRIRTRNYHYNVRSGHFYTVRKYNI